jgi:hypothetical protein
MDWESVLYLSTSAVGVALAALVIAYHFLPPTPESKKRE